MASIGSKVLASDYNDVYNLVNNILGVGTGTSGYGQILNASTLTPTTKIRKSQWDLLRQDILRVASHQGLSENASWTSGNTTSIPTLVSVSTTTKLTVGLVNSYLNAINMLSYTYFVHFRCYICDWNNIRFCNFGVCRFFFLFLSAT